MIVHVADHEWICVHVTDQGPRKAGNGEAVVEALQSNGNIVHKGAVGHEDAERVAGIITVGSHCRLRWSARSTMDCNGRFQLRGVAAGGMLMLKPEALPCRTAMSKAVCSCELSQMPRSHFAEFVLVIVKCSDSEP